MSELCKISESSSWYTSKSVAIRRAAASEAGLSPSMTSLSGPGDVRMLCIRVEKRDVESSEVGAI